MVQRTYYAPPEPEAPAATWEPAPDDVHTLAHGYNLADVDRLTRAAVWRVWGLHLDYQERYDLAWSGIVEHLYSSPVAPDPGELIGAGQDAIGEHIRADARHHGLDHHTGYQEFRRFGAYWEWTARHAPSPEPRVVERAALWQIWPALTGAQRRVLLAIAAHGTRQAAATALGITHKTLTHHLCAARARFLALWHEGEPPSRVWGADRRVHRAGGEQVETSTRAAMKAIRHRDPQRARATVEARRLDRHGTAARYNSGCRCPECGAVKQRESEARRRAAGIAPRRYMTVAQFKEAVRRNAAGETWTAIAADLGFSMGYLRRLRAGEATPVPDEAEEASA